MARIAFILLTHKDPQGVIDQANRLTATGDYVAIHFDASAPASGYRLIRAALDDNPGVVFARSRIRCGWGEWSLVQASLEALRAAERSFPMATHFYMLSGDCMPIKSTDFTRDFLEKDDCDYIEAHDFFESDWIKTGIRSERLVYRHWFNERTHKTLFYASMALQKRLRLERTIPADLRIMIGSQWWCLRRRTIEAVLSHIDTRPEIVRFFRTTWIPDETFFQTMVAHVVPRKQMRNRTPTFLMFTDYGMPVTFYNDHYDLLLRQNYLFARKISAEALELRARLGALWQADEQEFPISDEGPRLHRFLTGRGRIGQRFAPRFWEIDGNLGRSRIAGVIVAKKWHVAKRLTQSIRDQTTVPAVDYIFNELDAGLPDMGGVASSVAKRERHRRALLRLLFDHFETRQMVLCIDPSALSLISDFTGDRAETRILFVDSHFDDHYLRGHMHRLGLISENMPEDIVERLLPAVRSDLEYESDQLRDMGFAHFHSIGETATDDINAQAIARFLDVSPEVAVELARTPHLFSD